MDGRRAMAAAAGLFALPALLAACAGEDPVPPTEPGGSGQPGSTPASPAHPQFDVAPYESLSPSQDIETGVTESELLQAGDPSFQVPRDFIPPIYSPEFTAAENSNLLDDELVMGVEINGDARAYPVRLLRVREMVNDTVGGTPVLVTW